MGIAQNDTRIIHKLYITVGLHVFVGISYWNQIYSSYLMQLLNIINEKNNRLKQCLRIKLVSDTDN